MEKWEKKEHTPVEIIIHYAPYIIAGLIIIKVIKK
jgi:hypothetical protein